MAKAAYVCVAETDALEPGQNRCVEVAGHRLLLCRTAQGFFAVSPVCSHTGQPLEGGRMRGGHLICPHHGARFDLRTGRSSQPSVFGSIMAYPVRVTGTTVEVMLPVEA